MAIDGFNALIHSVNKFHADNARCPICGRDKRRPGIISPNTIVTRRCSGCGEPLEWTKTGPSGEQEEWEWLVEHQRAVKKRKSGTGRIRININ